MRTMAGDRAPRRFPEAAEEPDIVFNIRYATDTEARILRDEQASIVAEVLRWVAQNRSALGSNNAA